MIVTLRASEQEEHTLSVFKELNLKVSNSALRTVDYKGGLDFYLKSVKSFKLSPKAKKLKNKIIAKA